VAILSGKFRTIAFIVSSGRTGTTALAQHLDACYPEVRALHEPRPSWRLRRASAKALCGKIGRDELARLLADSRLTLLETIVEPVYIESNPYLGGFIEAFGQVFDRPRIIHVVRDPRSFIRSSMNFGTFRGIKQLAQSLIPYWLPRPENCPGWTHLHWADMSEPLRLAWYWALINRELNRGEQLYGPLYCRVRFEELFARDGSGLYALTDWLGLPRSQELVAAANRENVNASGGGSFPPASQWDRDLHERVLEYCGELMRLYGYDAHARPDSRDSQQAAAGAPGQR
jgi:hypothetical protein